MRQHSSPRTDRAQLADASDFPHDEPSRGPLPGLALDPPVPDPEHPPEIPADRLDPDALKVIFRLRHMGHQAYLVGGCVRDVLLDKKPKDFDIATSAHPGEVRAIFRNCRLIGRRFRLAHVYFRGGKVLEVATFRANPTDQVEDLPEDGDLLITRDNVFGTAEEDARRRDFTVNGLFYDCAAGEVIDHVGGRADLEAHRIATIGDPDIRMREDPVRALRAIRFAARLGFTIAPDTFEAMRRYAKEIARCAAPRVLEEIFKILRCGASARAFELLRAAGALPVVLPAVSSAIDALPEDGRRRAQAHLAALDELVRSGAEVSEAVLLGTLLAPVRGPEDAPGGPLAAQDELLRELVTGSRLPRKIAERAKLALSSQRVLKGPPRRRRRRSGGIAGQSYFLDAVQLLEIAVKATGEGADELARWRPSADGATAPSGEAEPRQAEREGEPRRGRSHGRRGHHGPAAAPAGGETIIQEVTIGAAANEAGAPGPGPAEAAAEGDAHSRRRRRRRGGRRRRRRGAADAGGPPPSP
ncbi:polynucleotide adenylyltransferase PcnB [Anaeromyxobacter paludicola]|uniref:Poly(A) polymerase I n=1 Tax=Anaeromyxobacter paludicola TaxID=2918171 RepID=A0ABN6N8C3_9BACT|nr:polynucleotide adenylyltransferase PcnB [Anaeromyxobacter paludicola]BDG09458.1 hypothetical protein AMPC_25710 [Anaeromyxobacter paludicola]